MDNEKTAKKPGIFGKIGALWKSGVKGKVICIVGVLVILGIIGAFTDDEEGGGGGDWKYTDEYFFRVFAGVKEDEGVIYKHFPRDITMLGLSVPDSDFSNVKVLQATRKGNLVESEAAKRLVFVVTPGKRYEDGQTLGEGYYIRRGSFEYENALGAECTVARYVEVTDKGILAKIQKQIEEEKAAAEKAKLEAEGQPFEVDAPIKSLCGFSIGATPSSVQSLFKGELKQFFGDEPGGELVTPFRHFDYANVGFKPDPRSGGQHLYWVELSVKDDSAIEDWENEENFEEVKTIVAMLEKKFDIKFKNTKESLCELAFRWNNESTEDGIVQKMGVGYDCFRFWLTFESDFISKKEEEALKKKQEPAKLSADEGADLL